MTNPSPLATPALALLCQRTLLICGSGWLVGLINFSSAPAVAQTAAPVDSTNLGAIAPPEPISPAEAPATPMPETIALPEFSQPIVTPITPAPEIALPAEVPAAPTNLGDPSIDRTQRYSLGATQREELATRIAATRAPSYGVYPRVESTTVNPAFSSRGISWAPGSTTEIGRQYFSKKALRALGRPGNGNIRLLFPLAIPAPITSLFGWRTHPITGDQRFHSGTDIGAPLGTPVLAAYTGRVILAEMFGGYGLAVALEHSKGTQQTLYAHLSELFVKPGEVVQQGKAIGLVGSTGASTGPHLHFEFRQLTSEGWVAMDAGEQLELSLAQLVKSLELAQATSAKPKLPNKG
jgi:murein DD-endopeptidase MepM/ murein hydrolase activator NlpD